MARKPTKADTTEPPAMPTTAAPQPKAAKARSAPQPLTAGEKRRRLRAGAYHDGSKPLSAKKVAKLKGAGRYHDALIRGLYLQITESGARSWLLRYEIGGRERMMGLGSAADFTLKEARERARAARQLIADGIDPLLTKRKRLADAKAAAAAALTFREAAQLYFNQHQTKWSSAKHRDTFMASLTTHAFPQIGHLDVAAITLADVLRCIEPHWTSKAVTMDRVRNRIENVIDWAVVRGHRPAGTNPARWRGHLDNALPAPREVAPIEHHAALDYREVPAFLQSLPQRDDTIAAAALTFLILNASRANEVMGACWPEINFDDATWTVPASRMKTRIEHRVPLSAAAVELLRSLPREAGNDYCFIGATRGHALNYVRLKRLVKRSQPNNFVIHGFRSAFRVWSAEKTNYPREVCERALAHKVGSKTEQAYDRGDLFDKRRKLMEAWS